MTSKCVDGTSHAASSAAGIITKGGNQQKQNPEQNRGAGIADFIIRLRADHNDGVRGLRQLLKAAWREHRLKCISAIKEQEANRPKNPEQTLETNYTE
jgi:hypothetical protein